MIEGREGQPEPENREFKEINTLAEAIHKRGKSHSAKFGEVQIPVLRDDHEEGAISFKASTSDLPDRDIRYKISRFNPYSNPPLADSVLAGHTGTFVYEDCAPDIDAAIESWYEFYDDYETSETKKENEQLAESHRTMRSLGLNILSDAEVHKFLKQTKGSLGKYWPDDIDLPDESAGGVPPTAETYALFGSVAGRIAGDSETRLQHWSKDEKTFTLETDLTENEVESHSLVTHEDAGEDHGIPLSKVTEWQFPRATKPNYVTFTKIDSERVDPELLEGESRSVYESRDAKTQELMNRIYEDGLPNALPEQISEAKTILQRRKDALPAGEE